ncbi:MAG: zinc ribbon domain-containing protein [Desulfococcaceae bacterium]|nr:zinc ribbon domain-containing protein [Desulfococcaceae bacterium]
MPLFDYLCPECGKSAEFLLSSSDPVPPCPECGNPNMKKLLSAHASISGAAKHSLPGPGDTACCGSSPHQANCAGPGSCCGRNV